MPMAAIEPIVIWRAASEMVNRHGNLAPIECVIRAEEMLENGDVMGQTVWLAIGRAAKSLLENGPPSDIDNA
jgi:hypothetical protein